MAPKDPTKTQADLTREIGRNLEAINAQLSNQLKMQNLINLSITGQLDKAKSVGAITEKMIEDAGITAAGTTTSIVGLTAANNDAAASQTEIGVAAVDAASATMAAWDANAALINGVISRPIAEELDVIQRMYGGLSGPGGPFASRNALSKQLVDTTMGLNREMTDMDGKWAKIFGRDPRRSIGQLNEVMGDFNEMITGDQGMIDGLKIASDFTEDQVIAMKSYAKAANLDMDDVQNVVSRQISRTGKAGTDMLAEVAVFSKKLAKATGDSSKMISQNIVQIIDDTDKFGNVTVAQAARISVTLRQLGLGYEDLEGSVGKFLDFEGAADSVSKLTTVFGVQMDAMEMMTLANTDQEEFLRRMREDMLSTGKAVDQMTLAEKRLIKEVLGLQDIQSVERLLDPSAAITPMEDLTNVTNEGMGSMEENMDLLREDILDLEGATRYTSEMMAAHIKESFLAPTQESLIELDLSMGKFGSTIERAIPKSASLSMELLGRSMAEITGLDEVKLETLRVSITGIAESLKEAGAEIKDSDLGKELEGILESAGMAEGMADIGSGLEESFDSMAATFVKAIDKMTEALKPYLVNSPGSEIGDEIGLGLEHPITTSFTSIGEKSEETADIMIKQGKRASDASSFAMSAEVSARFEAHKQGMSLINSLTDLKIDSDSEAMLDARVTLDKSIELLKEAEEAELDIKVKGIQESAAAQSAADVAAIEERKKNLKQQAADEKVASKRRLAMLDRELKNRESFYGAEAREIGKKGETFRDLTTAQKEEYRKRLNLGTDYEKELKKIFASETFKEGMGVFKAEKRATSMLESMKERGLQAKDLTEKQLKGYKEDFGLDKEAITKALAEGGDIGAVVAGGSKSRQEVLEKEEGTKAEAGEEYGEARAAAQATRDAMNAHLSNLASATSADSVTLKEIKVAIDTLNGTISTKKEPEPNITVAIDGQAIASAVARNPVTPHGTLGLAPDMG